MATPNLQVIQALRRTAQKLAQGAKYQWGHMGQCNCGNLAQEIVHMTEAEIHAHALRTREGDWSEQTAEYCGDSKLPLDSLITKMLEVGFTITDLQHLERLSDERILQRLPKEKRNLQYNLRQDVITYMLTWADMLEEELLEQLPLPEFAPLVTEQV
ncbi:MAG: hypothetical protein NZ551_01590 [Microscillaceae bacterium]|nr:hypothetical protein [Microscillaceae bacterium]MDW8459881.1 hypothetical protein [Cytophagales bacterium]